MEHLGEDRRGPDELSGRPAAPQLGGQPPQGPFVAAGANSRLGPRSSVRRPRPHGPVLRAPGRLEQDESGGDQDREDDTSLRRTIPHDTVSWAGAGVGREKGLAPRFVGMISHRGGLSNGARSDAPSGLPETDRRQRPPARPAGQNRASEYSRSRAWRRRASGMSRSSSRQNDAPWPRTRVWTSS